MENKDFPCICGHSIKVHPLHPEGPYGMNAYAVCDGCFVKNRPGGIRQLNSRDCSKFKQDNLKYIEQLYEEKSK